MRDETSNVVTWGRNGDLQDNCGDLPVMVDCRSAVWFRYHHCERCKFGICQELNAVGVSEILGDDRGNYESELIIETQEFST